MHLSTLLLPLLGSSAALAASDDKCACTLSKRPTPTLPFTLAAFQSPYPPGSNASGSYGVSGVRVRAYDGGLWVDRLDEKPRTGCERLKGKECPVGNETVVWVDERGGAWLDSMIPQPIYLNTRTGILSYLPSGITTFPPGANAANFLHLGEGTSVTSPLPGPDPPAGFFNAGPGRFEWNGDGNGYWVLCPRGGLTGRSGLVKEATRRVDGRKDVRLGAEAGGKRLIYQVMKFVGGKEDWGKCLFGIQLIALDYEGGGPAAGEYL